MIYRSFLRKMVYKGYAKKDPQNGDYSFIISNQKLYKITRTVPLQDFIDKQFPKVPSPCYPYSKQQAAKTAPIYDSRG